MPIAPELETLTKHFQVMLNYHPQHVSKNKWILYLQMMCYLLLLNPSSTSANTSTDNILCRNMSKKQTYNRFKTEHATSQEKKKWKKKKKTLRGKRVVF